MTTAKSATWGSKQWGVCPLCGSADATLLYDGLPDRVYGVSERLTRLVRCDGCGAAYQDPMPAEDELAGMYASYYTHAPPPPPDAPHGAVARARRAIRNGYLNAALGYDLQPAAPFAVAGPLKGYFERAVRSLPKGRRVLDVGCGNGSFLSDATHAGWDAEGIDLDPQAVAAAREAGLEASVGTIDAHADRDYDAVTLSHVIEHVPDPIAFLRAAHGLLRPSGTLWVATPNLASITHATFGADWEGLDPPRHLVLFNAPALARALARAGFADVRVQPPGLSAAHAFAVSAAVRDGEVPAYETARSASGWRQATLRSWRDPSSADELVVLARA
jgi:SAM-dependent methyltransferase